jgi:hypothetical protein
MHNQAYYKLFNKTKIKEYWWDAQGLALLRKNVSDVLDWCLLQLQLLLLLGKLGF